MKILWGSDLRSQNPRRWLLLYHSLVSKYISLLSSLKFILCFNDSLPNFSKSLVHILIFQNSSYPFILRFIWVFNGILNSLSHINSKNIYWVLNNITLLYRSQTSRSMRSSRVFGKITHQAPLRAPIQWVCKGVQGLACLTSSSDDPVIGVAGNPPEK